MERASWWDSMRGWSMGSSPRSPTRSLLLCRRTRTAPSDIPRSSDDAERGEGPAKRAAQSRHQTIITTTYICRISFHTHTTPIGLAEPTEIRLAPPYLTQIGLSPRRTVTPSLPCLDASEASTTSRRGNKLPPTSSLISFPSRRPRPRAAARRSWSRPLST